MYRSVLSLKPTTPQCGPLGRTAIRLFHAFLLVLLAAPAWAIHPHVDFAELVQSADVVFVGTVISTDAHFGINDRVIVTDVTFQVEALVHAGSAVAVDASEQVVLTFAGGQVGDRGVTVSGVPEFEVGQTYVVFSRLDGQSYMNPLVGGAQGLFKVALDAATGEAYPLTPGGLGIAAVRDSALEFTTKVERIEGGVATLVAGEFVMAPPGQPAAGSGDSVEDSLRSTGPTTLVSLNQFISEIEAELQQPPPADAVLRGVWNAIETTPNQGQTSNKVLVDTDPDEAVGHAAKGISPVPALVPVPQDDTVAPGPWESGKAKGALPDATADAAVEGQPGQPPAGDERAALCYCGAFNLFLVMEQVPTSWWEWGENNYAMALYNYFMDIYRYVPDDGSYGNNDENEFGGYPSSQDLINNYGQGWNGELAITWTFWSGCQCCTITQADVFFNPAYSWWQNFSDTFNQSGRVLYRPVVDHELGHSWGMQRGSCTEDYSYSQISVMHAYYFNIVEDGYGIHHPEAYSIRQTYQGQTGILPLTDVGVESYYASGSLINSTTDTTSYQAGDSITISNVTVENNSHSAVYGMRIRFYLGGYQMGSYWYWDSFPAETYNTGTYTTTIPDVPPGTYYVWAVLTLNGDAYSYDDLSYNNTTYLASTIQVAPVNDYCWDYTAIGLGTYYGSTNGADYDYWGASCGSTASTPDVFYLFTAPCTGTLAVDSCGSSYDTVLSVLTTCYGTELACNDDCYPQVCGLRDSCLTLSVAAGEDYVIRVSGYNGASGDFVLNLSYAAPANDACASATPVSDGTTLFSNCGATTDGPDEPAACDFFGYTQIDADTWYLYTASCTGDLTVSLCGSTYDTKLAVYSGCPTNGGTILACNDDYCAYQSQVTFPAVASTSYLIRIGGYLGETGEGTLAVTCGGGASLVGDLNCDGVVGFGDINPFVLYLSNYATWEATYPDCPPENGDINGDGAYPSFADINPFVMLLSGS
ncbi:MAG: hypothetical protein KA383_06745 [Phycisphaerae bacterium]|nr:hypothetical protein [Phycisphaerae bacterium]